MRIKNIFLIGSTAFAMIASSLLSGCASKQPQTPELEIPNTAEPDEAMSEAESPEPKEIKAPKISGKNWTGYYYRTDKPGRLAITAVIKQNKSEIKLITSKEKNKIHNLEGNITPDGKLHLEDKIQPTIWISSYGAATPNSLKVVAPIGDEGKPASQIITLRR